MAHPGGRPTIYTKELAELICERIATTGLGTTKLCTMYDDLPDESTIYAWKYRNKEFLEMYRDAKQSQAELMAEKIHDLCEVDTFLDKYGVERVDQGKVALQKLKVDAVKWHAARLAPRVYGDKIEGNYNVKVEDVSTRKIRDAKEKCDI